MQSRQKESQRKIFQYVIFSFIYLFSTITHNAYQATTQKAFDLCRDFVNDPKTLIEIAEDLGARYKE